MSTYTVESVNGTCRHRANTAGHAAELHTRLHIAAGAEARPVPDACGWWQARRILGSMPLRQPFRVVAV